MLFRSAIIKKVLQTLIESGKIKLGEQKIPALKEAIRKLLAETSTKATSAFEGNTAKSETDKMFEKKKLVLKKKAVEEGSVSANVGGYSSHSDAYPSKPFNLYDLEEASTMAGGNVEGGPTKMAFKNTDQMQEPRRRLKGKPLQEKIKLKRKSCLSASEKQISIEILTYRCI